jgi:hypothetical protein
VVFVYGRRARVFAIGNRVYETTSTDWDGGFTGEVVCSRSRRFDQHTFQSEIRAGPARPLLSSPVVPGKSSGTADARAFVQSLGGVAR